MITSVGWGARGPVARGPWGTWSGGIGSAAGAGRFRGSVAKGGSCLIGQWEQLPKGAPAGFGSGARGRGADSGVGVGRPGPQ
eukprot:6125715-Prymnesium_polylepis.1